MKYAYDKHITICTGHPELVKKSPRRKTLVQPVANIVPVVPVQPMDERQARINSLTTMFTRFEQMLYEEGTVGISARNGIISLFILRLLEPHFRTGKIDILDAEKYMYNSSKVKPQYVKCVMMTELAKLSKEEVEELLRNLWEYVLAEHPLTREIFQHERYPRIASCNTLFIMIEKLAHFDFENYPMDCLAEVYQHFIHRQFRDEKSSKMGQFFTPGWFIDTIIADNHEYIKVGKICDPFCGTAGFLLGIHNILKENPEWNPCENIYGSEIDNDTYKFAAANLLIATGGPCPNLLNKTAFKETTNKYDIIMTNPPFSGKATRADNIGWFAKHGAASKPLAALQLCMHMLADDGLCVIILPYGKDVIGKHKSVPRTYKDLIECHEIHKVTIMHNGAFEHTGVKTVVISFSKRANPVGDIPFYERKDKVETHLITVSREQMKNHDYSMQPDDYMEKPHELVENNGTILVKLRDIIKLAPKSKYQASFGKPDGKYPFIRSSQIIKSYVDEPAVTVPSIILGTGGNPSIHYCDQFSSSADTIVLQINRDDIYLQYVYNYLKSNMRLIEALFHGATIKHLSRDRLLDIHIPIPVAEKQNELLTTIDRLEKDKINARTAILSAEAIILSADKMISSLFN